MRVSLRGVTIGPGGEGGNLRICQRVRVRKLAIMRISKPGRHLSGCDRFLYGRCPGSGLLISKHGEWARFARTVANLTVTLQNGCNIGSESWNLFRLPAQQGCRTEKT